ncbi:glucose-1-phosphate thymidylyltransferase [Fibrobacter sp. UWR3]|uniref:sugar phosphate nucleotidyltransferase n=1 Tax=Fibrobacter sp. UWR3 TaxID=1896217 RepID=UPI00091CAFED|nr:sugar phosphate nucleotidyltransferase [Fibrobacter sp. UWR3]SHN04392.1 glucose-1-phosphate thymidylyltransferase [Fibrobacter sp. UWR3]
MKIILPVAGKGERMRPYTNNLPKCLLPVGGKTIIDWIVGDTRQLAPTETIFITGYKAEAMDRYLAGKPEWGKTRTVLQSDPQGLGQAISLALPYTSDDEPLLIILGDTLFDADLGRLADESENVLYTYTVQDPRRFGVAVTGENGRIERLVEKPQEFVSDEAIVGIYYIKDVKALRAALKHLMDNDIRTRGEFQLTDALQMMIEQGCKFRTAPVREWLDCGLPETLIQTNTWLLQNKFELNNISRAAVDQRDTIHNVKLIPPCIIGKNVTIENCTIGPNVTIGDNCKLKNLTMNNCIMWDNEETGYSHFENQIIASC